jgi:ribosomal-protein-alanine N-acetyltransferase
MATHVATYFLQSARLGFGTWAEADLPLAMALWGDPQVMHYNGGALPPAGVEQRLARERANLATLGIQYWPIFLLGSGEHVGCCGLQPRDAAAGIHELGYYLRPAYWQQGFASEAARAMVEYAFRTLNAPALFAGHYQDNVASKRVLERLGFRYTHHEYYPPSRHDEPCYLLARGEFV